MTGYAGRRTLKAPPRWTANTDSTSSSESFAIDRSRRMPALCTTASTRPYASRAVAMSAAPPSAVAIESADATALPPALRIASTTASAATPTGPSPWTSRPTSLTTTDAPRCAINSACARPMPPPAPVITTTRPSKSTFSPVVLTRSPIRRLPQTPHMTLVGRRGSVRAQESPPEPGALPLRP